MFDYLLSRMVWIIAAVLLTASVIGIFTWQQKSLQETKLEEQIEDISGIIDEVSTTNSEFNISISFADKRSDYYFDLPTSCNLNFTTDYIYFQNNGQRGSERIYRDIYLYNPILLTEDTPSTTLNKIQNNVSYYNLDMNDRIIVESKKFNQIYKTFIYSIDENKTDHINRIKSISKKLEHFYRWNISTIRKGMINKSQKLTIKNNVSIYKNFFITSFQDKIIPCTISKLHLWEPSQYKIKPETIINNDSENRVISIRSDMKLTLERRRIKSDGNDIILNFLYV